MNSEIIPVLCNEKNMANYAYILRDKTSETTAIIDAAESMPIIAALEQLQLKADFILTTHHHFDHIGGNLALKEKYGARIIAPKTEFSQIPGADIPAEEGQTLSLGNIKIEVIKAPGHTNGHVLYYLPDEKKIFTGDVLFNLCIGGLFEGTPQQMFATLQKIKALPDDVEFFPGHEYTRSCLPPDFEHISGFAPYLQKMLTRENGKLAPVTLGEEKKFNPYLQFDNLTAFLSQD